MKSRSGYYGLSPVQNRDAVRLFLVKIVSEDKEESKQHSKDETILQKTEDEVFIKKESCEDTPRSEKNFTLKLLKSPLVWLLSLQFFLGSLRVYTGTGLMVSSFFEGTYDNSFSQYDSIYYAVKNQTNENELEKFLQNEMDIFVGIQSILVPVSSPIFGFILDSIQMAFGNVHYAILSGFRTGSWRDKFPRTTDGHPCNPGKA